MLNRNKWYKPAQLELMDLLDKEILKIGLLHGYAKRANVPLTRQTLVSIRKEFYTVRRLSKLLSPVQRLLACQILSNTKTEHHLQDLLLNILVIEDGNK